jgi:hypothetical protein
MLSDMMFKEGAEKLERVTFMALSEQYAVNTLGRV